MYGSEAEAGARILVAREESVLLSVVIKCLNEETNIARAIESALEATETFGGEVIVADCISSDRTVEIAAAYPIKVVQLSRAEDRSCGAGAQLGVQHAVGDYIYLMDGDMALQSGFILEALEFMSEQSGYAGVAGRLADMHTSNAEFELRSRRAQRERPLGDVDRLDGGGLYRSSAIRALEYFADTNLRSFEELELGSRLRSRGWKLARIDHLAVEHYGYTLGGYSLLLRRWKTGYVYGLGQLLRSAAAKDDLLHLIRSVRLFAVSAFVYIWLTSIILAAAILRAPLGILIATLLLISPVAALSVRQRSLKLGTYSIASWVVNGAGLIMGLLQPRSDPRDAIGSHIISEPSLTRTSKIRDPEGVASGSRV